MQQQTATTMCKICYLLYIGDVPVGAIGRVELTGEKDIIELREIIYEKRKDRLGGAAKDLEVYAPGTEVQIGHGSKQLEDKDLATLINQKEHLIVGGRPGKNFWIFLRTSGFFLSFLLFDRAF
jgi:hypothetical protein